MARKRRDYAPKFKFEVAMEYLSGKKGRAEILKEYDISDSTLERWYRQILDHGHELFMGQNGTALAEKEQEIAKLERMVGRLATEIGAAKKVSDLLRYRS
jgi:transposase-like protein